MKTLTTVEEIADEISNRLREDNVSAIGIDGKDGSGKSWLAAALSERLSVRVIGLDDYLEKKQGGYTQYLDVAAIKQKLEDMPSPVIIEGVCLLAATERIDVEVDIYIYVKRMSPYGTWRDEEECDPSMPPEDLISKLGEDLKQFAKFESILNGNNIVEKEGEVDGEINLPELVKELIRYHANYRPAINADYVFERNEA